MIAWVAPRSPGGIARRAPRWLRWSAGKPITNILFSGPTAGAALAVALLLLLICQAATQGMIVQVPTVHKRGDNDKMDISHDEGKQVDGSTYLTEGDENTDGGWAVVNPDGTSIAQVHYGYIDESGAFVTTTDPVIFTPGKDCTFIDEKPLTMKECRPNKDNQLVFFDVTYYEYSCQINGGTIKRRVSHAVPTDTPCNVNDYRASALTALDWDEHWPNYEPPPPPPPPPVACTATPQGRIRPILVATDSKTPGYMSVIWIDEKGNQFVAIYNADGTTVWEASGTAPAKPTQEELAKAGTLSASEFREFVNKMPKSPDKCETKPDQPKPPDKTAGKPELPKSDKKPRKEVIQKTNERKSTKSVAQTMTSKKGARAPKRQETQTATEPGFDIGIAGFGLGRFGGRGGGFGDHGLGGGGRGIGKF